MELQQPGPAHPCRLERKNGDLASGCAQCLLVQGVVVGGDVLLGAEAGEQAVQQGVARHRHGRAQLTSEPRLSNVLSRVEAADDRRLIADVELAETLEIARQVFRSAIAESLE